MLYTKNGNIFKENDFVYYNEGSCANIYKKDNIVLKKYKDQCDYGYYLKFYMFNLLKELDLPNIVKLLDCYYEYNDKLFKLFRPDAYTMEFIEPTKKNILQEKSEYLLDIINSFDDTCLKLANNKIKIYDAHKTNIIFHDNGATLIDVDLFKKMLINNYNQILIHNRRMIVEYVKSKLLSYYDSSTPIYFKLIYILSFEINYHDKLITSFKNVFDKETAAKSLIKYLK